MVAENNEMSLPSYLGTLEDACNYINKNRKGEFVRPYQVLLQLERNKTFKNYFIVESINAKKDNDNISRIFFQRLSESIHNFEVVINDQFIIVQTSIEE